MMKVLLLTTGGTIDSLPYPEDNRPANATSSGKYYSLDYLRGVVPDLDWKKICDKDSKHLDEADLSRLQDAIGVSNYERIIVTVGTDRMTDIARAVKDRITPSCPVVFTGAIWPISNGAISDGPDNLRLAATGNPDIAAGVYIAMHGLFLPCDKIRKDLELQRFVAA